MPSEPGKRAGRGAPARRHWLLRLLPVALLLALLVLIAVLALRPDPQFAPGAAPVPGAQAGARTFAQAGVQAGAPGPGERAAQRQQLVDNFTLADHTYCSYREGSMYPAHSRPMSQNPDQAYPNRPVIETNALRSEDRRSHPEVLIQSAQSRVYLAPGEAVTFTLRALAPDGSAVPLVVTRAVAAGMVLTGARPTAQVPLVFAEAGAASGLDPAARDGAQGAVLNPAQTGLALFHGTIRTEVRFTAGGKNGVLIFDVIHSPQAPALWSGAPREAMEGGSLAFILRADVRTPGRYIVTGRIDDARGRPFALATFNEVLGAGPNDIRLVAFGKLMVDGAPQLPLTLRDVDGYLLKENADPDRELMPRLSGPVLTSKLQSLQGVSDAEWSGEERQRYLTEFGKDRNQAAAALTRFDPLAPLPPRACPPN